MDEEVQNCMLIAAHGWDVAGAKWAGMKTASISRPGQQLSRLWNSPFATERFEGLSKRSLTYSATQTLIRPVCNYTKTVVLAIRHRMTVHSLAHELFPYLTMVEGPPITPCSRNANPIFQ
jgi:hypothetical protein